MRYALFVYDTPDFLDQLTEQERRQVYDEFVAVSAIPGIIGHRLQPPHTAITLSIEGDEQSTTDGPHTNPKRQLIGFYLLQTDDASHALEIATQIPTARLGGAIQIQPLVEEP
jgi:hypothetical protein